MSNGRRDARTIAISPSLDAGFAFRNKCRFCAGFAVRQRGRESRGHEQRAGFQASRTREIRRSVRFQEQPR